MFNSYYGGLTCVCWTPDGKYVLTGGQDDLISVWSVADSGLVARCQGHQSWVSALAFDPWRCDDRNYRFGSVGEDGRLCLWDFGVGMLHRPKVGKHAPTVALRHTLTRLRMQHGSEGPSQCLLEARSASTQPAPSAVVCAPTLAWTETKTGMVFPIPLSRGLGSPCCRLFL